LTVLISEEGRPMLYVEHLIQKLPLSDHPISIFQTVEGKEMASRLINEMIETKLLAQSIRHFDLY